MLIIFSEDELRLRAEEFAAWKQEWYAANPGPAHDCGGDEHNCGDEEEFVLELLRAMTVPIDE